MKKKRKTNDSLIEFSKEWRIESPIEEKKEIILCLISQEDEHFNFELYIQGWCVYLFLASY